MNITVGEKPFPVCTTEIRCNKSLGTAVRELDDMFTLSLYSGAASMQTYLTRDEVISFANGLMAVVQMQEVAA